MKTSEKIKRLVGYRFQELFPNPKIWVGYTLLFSHTQSLVLEFNNMNMVIGKTYDRPHDSYL